MDISRRTTLKIVGAAGLTSVIAPLSANRGSASRVRKGNAKELPGVFVEKVSAGEFDSEYQRRQYEHGIAWHAKQLASGVFVAGREPDKFIENDLTTFNYQSPGWSLNHLHRWEDVGVDVDYDAKSVTLSAEGIPSRTAVYNGDLGVSILPKGETDVHFDPVDIPVQLDDADEMEWPMGAINAVDDDHPGVDYDALEDALDEMFDDSNREVPQYTRGVVVIYNGNIVAERYAEDFDKETPQIGWSMGKSYASTLTGILIKEDHCEIDGPVPVSEWHDEDGEYPGQYPDPRAGITLKNVLRMSSGLDFNRSPEEDEETPPWTKVDDHIYVYWGAINAAKYSTNKRLEFPPGEMWEYRNCNPIILASKVFRSANTIENDKEYFRFPQRALLDKIGVRNMIFEPDPYGNFLMQGYDWATTRDFARLGLLYLQDGEFADEQILPEWWSDFVSTPAPATENDQYGGMFWLNAGGSMKDVPRDTYYAAGARGQRIFVIPSEDLVITRNAHNNLADWNKTISDIIDAINSC